ncbi:response regulator transcription factor [Nocardioides psychrotolerans]|uniref:Two-component system, OmpR family, phosphate regulon response regulator PhoB n=1 Tax=Nocardioides psychrotolerans TaxID=1005945 RepID=A0A1I3E6V5_9ACTN|nr:response regulator [Nocardioides psychrotolerans]SFH94696.1 two-component system, OmpR family, phosphate regulon response regulator PhoB [Nocardioides psychrotolerans]
MASVLVADDDPDICFLLELHLTKSGHDVVAVANGAQALEKYAEHDFDVAVLDVSMPDKSGLDVIREVRAGTRHPDMPIVLLTALAHPTDRERGLVAGADDYVTKPFSLKGLVVLVDRLLADAAARAG